MLVNDNDNLHLFLQATDANVYDHLGECKKALQVFHLLIDQLKNKCIENLKDRRLIQDGEKIRWILTVAPKWNESAKQLIKKAAEMVRISS